MKDFVAYIVKNLVDNPDKVELHEIGGSQTLIIELQVDKSDIGKIIGKKGKTINAIRTLLMSVASRHNLRVSLEILEDDDHPRSHHHRTTRDGEIEGEGAEEQEPAHATEQ